MCDPLSKLLADMPSPNEQARTDFDHVMEHGTPQQKEALMIVLRLLAMLKPGPHTSGAVVHAADALCVAMS